MNGKSIVVFLLAIVVVMGSGCALMPSGGPDAGGSTVGQPVVREAMGEIVERFGVEHPARASDHPIEVFRVRIPDKPFEEIGIVRASAYPSDEENAVRVVLLEELKKAARTLGGDGIASLDEYSTTEVFGIEVVGAREKRLMTAVVIRYQ